MQPPSEHIENLPFTIPQCTSGDPTPLSLGSSLDPHEIVCSGWISNNDCLPQELVVDLLSTSTIHEISILVHETHTPESITIFTNISKKRLIKLSFANLYDRGNNKRIREQVSITLDPPQVFEQLRLVIEGGDGNSNENSTSNGTRKGIVSLSIRGVPIDHHAHHSHYHGSEHAVDSELHSLGLATLSEAYVQAGGTEGAHQILSNLDAATDTSTGVILDMLRKKKHDMIRAHSSSAEMNDEEANRLSHVFKSFDRVGRSISKVYHVKKQAIAADEFGIAAAASDKLQECFQARDFLAQREALRTWCCGGEDSNVFEKVVLSMIDIGWENTTPGLSVASPWIRAMRAAPLFTLPFSMQKVSQKQSNDNVEVTDTTSVVTNRPDISTANGNEEDAYEKWIKNLMQFHFGSDGVLYAQGIKKPSKLLGKEVLEVPFKHVFGNYLTQSIMDKKSWVLRQASLAVIALTCEDETGWLRKHLDLKHLKPVEFFEVAIKVVIYMSNDPILAVFKQVVETAASLLSILWTEEDEQCRITMPLLRSFVSRIEHSLLGTAKATRDVATRGLMFLANECEYIGPVKVAHTLYRALHRLNARSRVSAFEYLLHPYILLIDRFGCRNDPTLPPEDQHLSIRSLAHLSIELAGSRHTKVTQLALDIALKMYSIDISKDGQASRDALGINKDGAILPIFRTPVFVKKMMDVDRKLQRCIHPCDERALEGRGVNDDDEDENVRALKKQLAEMKAMMRKAKGSSKKKGKSKPKPKKQIQKTSPHPPVVEETPAVVEEPVVVKEPVIVEESPVVEAPPVNKIEESSNKLETGISEVKKEVKQEEKEPSPALMKKKMVIMKKIRDLKLSLLKIEDGANGEIEKKQINDKIAKMSKRLTTITEKDVQKLDVKEDDTKQKDNDDGNGVNKEPEQTEVKTKGLKKLQSTAKLVKDAASAGKKKEKCVLQ